MRDETTMITLSTRAKFTVHIKHKENDFIYQNQSVARVSSYTQLSAQVRASSLHIQVAQGMKQLVRIAWTQQTRCTILCLQSRWYETNCAPNRILVGLLQELKGYYRRHSKLASPNFSRRCKIRKYISEQSLK